MPQGSPLNRFAKRSRAPSLGEEYQRKVRRAVKKSAAAGSSVGRITPKERAAIRQLGRATRGVAGGDAARDVKRIARRKARKS